QTLRPPEDTSTGAVPLYAAKWSRLGNRNTWRTSPITVPAMTGPTPKIPVRLVPEARTAAASFLLAARSCASRRRMSSTNSAASSQRALTTASAGLTCSRMWAAWPAEVALRTPPGTRPQHRGQPARGLVTRAGQVTMPLRPHLQHHGVVLRDHRPRGRGAQRRDRYRERVVRVILAGVPGLQQPHPGGQLRRHIQHPLT